MSNIPYRHYFYKALPPSAKKYTFFFLYAFWEESPTKNDDIRMQKKFQK